MRRNPPDFAVTKSGKRDPHFKETMKPFMANSDFSSVQQRLNIWDFDVNSAYDSTETSECPPTRFSNRPILDTLSGETTYQRHQNAVQKPQVTFTEKLRGLLSPKGLALFKKEMPAPPGTGCENGPMPKNLKRQQNKHAAHFQATKKWSHLLNKIRLWKKHNACFIQRKSVCVFRECPVEDQKVRRISASRAFCKLRVFALRVGFKRVSEDLINWNDPSNDPYGDMSPAQFVALARALYKEKQEISKFRVKLDKELDHSNAIDNRRSKQAARSHARKALGPCNKLNASQIPNLSHPKREFRVSEVKAVKPAENAVKVNTVKETSKASVNVSESLPLPDSTLTLKSFGNSSNADHGDKVIAAIENVIPQLTPLEVRQETYKSLTIASCKSDPGFKTHPTKLFDQTTKANTLGPRPIPHSLKAGFKLEPGPTVTGTKSDRSKLEALTTTKAVVPTKTSQKVVLPEKSTPLSIVKKIASVITSESQVDSWLHKPKSQMWIQLNMEAVLVPHLNKNTFELKCLSVDLKILCITECENKINEYLSYLRLVVSVEKQESMRFEEVKNTGLFGAPAPTFIGVSKSVVTQDRPSIVSSGSCTEQLSHLRELVRAQDGMMNQYKKKFLAQFDIHDRIETYLKSILENLQVTGEVFVKICTDMASTDNKATEVDEYEQRLGAVKEHLEAMKKMDHSAKESIEKINAGFTESLTNVISGHMDACDLKEQYMDQFQQLWVQKLGKKTLTPKQLENVICCASIVNQKDFSDECSHLKAFEVLSQKLERIKALYKEVSKAREQLQLNFGEVSLRLATRACDPHGVKRLNDDYDYDIYNDYCD